VVDGNEVLHNSYEFKIKQKEDNSSPKAKPPPPPPPTASTLPPVSKDRKGLLSDIQKGKKLKKTVTDDRSGAIVSADKGSKPSGGGMMMPPMGGKFPKTTSTVKAPVIKPAVKPAVVPVTPKVSMPPPNGGMNQRATPTQIGKTPPRPVKQVVTAIALYNFTGERSGDLSLTINDTVVITKQEGAWWEGTCRGITGVFPSNYVQIQ